MEYQITVKVNLIKVIRFYDILGYYECKLLLYPMR